MRSRKRRARHQEPVELNITAFMNLMVILVPFLLITAVFSRMAILELNLPGPSSESTEPPLEMQLEVIVRKSGFEVGARDKGLLKSISKSEDRYEYQQLSEYLKRVKRQYPDKLDATVLLEPNIPYEVLVQVMDTMRETKVEKEGESVRVELFPEISVGDAPVRQATAALNR